MNDEPDPPSTGPSAPAATPPGEAAPAFGRTPNRAKPSRSRSGKRSGAGALRVWAPIAGAVLVIIAGAAVWGALTVQRFLASVPQVPPLAALMVVNQAPGMTFEDRSGRVIATRGPKHGDPVILAQLPAYVPQAFLAAEDRRFYQHGPVDLRGVARAAWANWRAHRTVQGGSTLTQQLAKTLFLTPDQTLTRKLQEMVIADRMEQVMTKDQVLEVYLNRIFFGDNAYGIDAAAQTYFGVPARSLNLQQAALLAALPKAPTRLALTNDMGAALARSHLVLHNMLAEGWITTQQAQTALLSPPVLAPETPGEGDFGYVLDMAAAQAVKIAGGQAPDLVVRLSIDSGLQTAGQAIVRQAIADDGKAAGVQQGALVLLAPDGGIRALVGGVDHQLSAFNRATQAQRQPGSAFKPFVYAAALESGVKPTDIRVDGPVRFGLWAPTNYEPGYRGPVTVADALAHSINTVAAQLANDLGGPKLGEIAHRFGLKSIPDDPNLSVALGSYEVNLLELTGGYQVFQQGGQRTDPYLIEQIATTRGDVLYTHVASAGMPVYDTANAGEMVRMMEGVITHGTATRAAFGRPAAGKTGTTQNWRDAWFVGFTPDWLCGVWIGNDDNTPMNKITGGALPAEIWRKMMLTAHDGFPVRDFPWLLPPTPADPPQAPASDAAPAEETAAADAVSKPAFYDSLSSDFADAEQGDDAHPADDSSHGRRDDPDPRDDSAAGQPPSPRPERQGPPDRPERRAPGRWPAHAVRRRGPGS